jgi:hypothetical protein
VVRVESSDNPTEWYVSSFTEIENTGQRYIDRLEVGLVIRNAKGKPLKKDDAYAEALPPGESVIIENGLRMSDCPIPSPIQASITVKEWLCTVTKVQDIDIIEPEATTERPF